MGLRRFGVLIMAALMLASSFSLISTPPARAAIFNVIPADSSLDPQDSFFEGQDVYAYVTSNLYGGRVCLDQHRSGQNFCTDIPPFAADFYPIVSHGVLTVGTGVHTLTGFPTDERDPSGEVTSVEFYVSLCVNVCDRTLDAAMAAQYKARAGDMVDVTAWACEMTSHWKGDSTKRVGSRSIVKGVSTSNSFSENYGIIAGNAMTFVQGFFGVAAIQTPGEEMALSLLKDISCATQKAYESIVKDPPNPDYTTIDTPTPKDMLTYPDATFQAFIDSFNSVYALNTATLSAYERYLGAAADGSNAGVSRQMANVSLLAGQTSGGMRDLATRLRAFVATLTPDADARSIITADDRDAIQVIQDRVRASGFTDDEKAQLRDFLFTDAQIDALAQSEFVDLDIADAKLDTPATVILTDLADDLEANAPFWEEFSAAALVISHNTETDPSASPVASFTLIPGDGPRDVTFTDTSTDADSDFLTSSWDFGDGSSGTGSPIDHTYAANGTYTVTLTASDGTLSDQASDTIAVPQANRAPFADFTISPDVVFAGTPETFTNNSTDPDGDTLTSAWDFGDGETSTETSPVHTYATGDTFRTVILTVSDGTLTDIRGFAFPVGASNTAPVAADDNLAAGGTIATSTVSVLTNDTDPDGDLPLALHSFTQGGHGSTVCNSDGTCQYSPDHLYQGPDTFTYVVRDSRGAVDMGTVHVVVDPVANQPPVAQPDGIYSKDGAAVTVFVLANDSDPDGDEIAFLGASNVVGGTLDCDIAGVCEFTPSAGFFGDAGFSYQIEDALGLSAAGTATIAVLESGVAYQTGDLFLGQGPSNFKLSRTGVLLDAFETVTGSVFATGMCFDAVGNLFATTFGGRLGKYDNNGVLVDGDWAGTALDGTTPESCVFDAAGNLYVGSADKVAGSDHLHKFDANGNLLAAWNPSTNRGTDWIDLAPDQCTLHYTSEASTVERFDVCTGTQLGAFASGLPAPCYALRILAEGGVIVACQAAIVRLSPTGEKVREYHPETNEFYFAMNIDPDGTSFWTTGFYSRIISHVDISSGDLIDQFPVPLAVPGSLSNGLAIYGERAVGQNHAPVGVGDAYDATVDTQLSVPALTGVLANDTDADDDALTAALATGPTHGALVLNANGSFAYTPSAGYIGPDSFSYRASDGLATSGVTIVSVTVAGTNHAPIGVADTYTVAQDAVLTVPMLTGVLANDTDADGDTLTAAKVSDPALGSVTLAANGSFVYTPTAGYFGPDSFTYNVSDGTATAGPLTVSIAVDKTNHTPTLGAVADRTITEMVLFTLALVGDDQDKDVLTYSMTSGPAGLTINPTAGALAWTPSEAQGPGTYPVTVRVTDPDHLFAERSFTINVTEVNRDPAMAAIADQTVNPGDAVSASASATDPDLPPNTLSYTRVTGLAGATVNASTGAFAWTASSTLGDYLVTIAVSDVAGGSTQRSFTIHVVRDATSLTLGGDNAGQYSDKATINATLKVGSTPVVDATVSISLGDVSKDATTNASGVASATFTIPGPAGTLPISASFAGTPSKAPSSASGAFTVSREDSSLVYSGDTLGLAGATLSLSATFTDSAAAGYSGPNPETGVGATIGDITKARVAFAIYSAASCLTGSPITTLSAFVTDTGTSGDGIGTAAVTWSSSAEGTFCIVPSLVGASGTGANGYYAAPPAAAAGLALFKDTFGKVTGGGWVALGDGRANFGFNATSLKGPVKGNLVYIERTTYRGTKAMLIVKSNAIDTFRTSGSTYPITASLSGKASFKYISSVDGSTLFESGNATFTATVVDTDAQGGDGDQFAIRVTNKTGAVLADLGTTPLGGGNIVAHLK